ncbi:hypothetical protein PHJA_000368200 [Phtheirospermum japonicum]|uniref:Uncharacterized protein n=1 Tax=Phtheirospermum japonicum TaxID=374723 RepID=A0A830B3K2_9LAMI|nr:hypothetical protein PHJA_000368200 [Phtheirospermum japonicum]
MEANTCDINHLEADVLLPPHKRLLAGLKKPTSCGADSEYDIRLNNLLLAHLSNPNLSNKEIAEASKRAAIEAAKIAEAKRANAEQKAAKAAKAVAAAKSALELVATLEDEAAKKDKCLKKNKAKKHVHVQELYDTDKGGNSTCGADEEMARNLHRAINSSPRILKSPTGHKRKKMTVDTEGYVKEIETITVDLNSSKRDKVDLDNGNGKSSRVGLEKDEFSEPLNGLGKKRGRIKQKKLSLSVCSFRDQTSPKDEVRSCVETSDNGLMPVETWKCQEFRAPACVSQNKVMQL